MPLSLRVILPRRLWGQQIPRLARAGGFGLARLVRNFHEAGSELIAQELLPVSASVRGRQFGPLDDLLLVQLQPAIGPGDPRELIGRFGPLSTQLLAGLCLGRHATSCRHRRVRSSAARAASGPNSGPAPWSRSTRSQSIWGPKCGSTSWPHV